MRKSEKEALQAMLDDEKETIKALEKAYQRAIRRIDNHIRILESDEMTQSKIYQKRYQEAMKAQISAALDELHKKSNQTIEEYLTRSYQHGYVGTMYSLHRQGMPILSPIDQRAVTRAVRTDSKLSGRLYGELGVDMQKLKKTIRREISIGISIGSDYSMIARQVQISSGIPLKRAKTMSAPRDTAFSSNPPMMHATPPRVKAAKSSSSGMPCWMATRARITAYWTGRFAKLASRSR